MSYGFQQVKEELRVISWFGRGCRLQVELSQRDALGTGLDSEKPIKTEEFEIWFMVLRLRIQPHNLKPTATEKYYPCIKSIYN